MNYSFLNDIKKTTKDYSFINNINKEKTTEKIDPINIDTQFLDNSFDVGKTKSTTPFMKEYTKESELLSEITGKEVKPTEFNIEYSKLPDYTKDLYKAKSREKSVEKTAKILTAPIRWTAGALATALTSYAIERADSDLEFKTDTTAKKLLIGENDVKRLTEQEDLYGTIARGIGVPASLIAMSVIENPFIAGTGAKTLIKEGVSKQVSKKIGKIGMSEFVKIIDDVIEAEVKSGKINKEVSEKLARELTNLKITEQPPIKETSIIDGTKKEQPLKYERTIAEPSIPNRIKDETIEKGLKADFRNIDEYNKVSFKDQANKVGEIIDEDPEKAIRIALGKEMPTNGALPESVFIAVKNKAIKNGDTDLLVRLATEEGGVAKESTVLGQRIKMLDEGLTDDPFKNINDVVKKRRSVFEKKNKVSISKAKSKEIKNIKNSIKPPKVDEWQEFIKEITC